MSSKAMRAARHASRNVSNQEWEQQACERQAGSQRCSPSACLNANTLSAFDGCTAATHIRFCKTEQSECTTQPRTSALTAALLRVPERAHGPSRPSGCPSASAAALPALLPSAGCFAFTACSSSAAATNGRGRGAEVRGLGYRENAADEGCAAAHRSPLQGTSTQRGRGGTRPSSAPTCCHQLGFGAARFLQRLPCRRAVRRSGRRHRHASGRQRAVQQRRQRGHAAALGALGCHMSCRRREAGWDRRLGFARWLLLLLQKGDCCAHISQEVVKALGACSGGRGSRGGWAGWVAAQARVQGEEQVQSTGLRAAACCPTLPVALRFSKPQSFTAVPESPPLQ